MSATDTDISVDLGAVDAAKAAEATKKTPNAATSTPIEIIEAPQTAKTPETPVLTPDAGLEKLKKQLEDEKTARIAAERHAAESAEAERQARTEVQTSQLDITKTAIDTMKQAQKSLRSEYATAMQAQDFEKVAEIQEAMSDNSAKLLYLENSKSQLEKAPKPIARAPVDPVERFVSTMTPQSAAWVRAHPEYVRDQRKNDEMISAHRIAISRGRAADTPEYFKEIEKVLELGSPVITHADPADDPMAAAAQPSATPSRQAAPPAAPVSRSGNGTGSRSNVYRATPEEVEAAEFSGLSIEEYIRNREAIKKEKPH
jgi:hypothetical protein